MNRLAILNPGRRGDPTYIDWHETARFTASHPIPGVENFSAIKLLGASSTDLEHGESGLSPAKKPAATALRHAATLGAFLGSTIIRPADWALCEITRPAGWPNVSIFAPIRLGDFSGEVFTKGVSGLRGSINDYAELTITTGPCLFSGSALKAVSGGELDGVLLQPNIPISRLVQDIIVDQELSLYELESTARLTSLISGLVSTLPKTLPVGVVLDVPRVQYYFYLLDAYGKGLVQKAQLLRWFDLVDRRHEAVASDMRMRLARQTARTDYLVRVSSGMAPLETLTRKCLEADTLPTIQQMVALLSAEDPLWQVILDSQIVDDHLQLVNLSYTVEQLRAGQWRNNGSVQRLGIAVENYDERLTYRRTMQIARELQRVDPNFEVSLLGMYSAGAIFTHKNNGATDLYIQNIGKQFTDKRGSRSHTASELIAAVYQLDV